MSREIVIAVDGGGTGTKFLAGDVEFEVGPSNFQTVGVLAAKENVKAGLARCLDELGAKAGDVAAVVYGLAGADRDKDFVTVREFLREIHPGGEMVVVNDTLLALYAARPDGNGVALIAGTGTNCIGQNRAGDTFKIGGLGPWMGDFGSGEDLTIAATSAAMRWLDGRGRETILADEICAHLGLAELVDVIEYGFFDKGETAFSLAPLVFDCAKKGDAISIEILERAGKDAGLRASIVLSKLFADDDEKHVVLGGSIFQKGSTNHIVGALTNEVRKKHPRALIEKLNKPPAAGGEPLFLDFKARGKI